MSSTPHDFAGLAKQYWGLMGEALQTAVPKVTALNESAGFREAMAAWTQALAGGHGGFDQVLGHFSQQNNDWMAQMQQLAAQFSGREHSTADVVKAWRQLLGDNPFQDLMQGMRGPGLAGIAQWSAMTQPWLQGLRGEVATQLGLPAFGFTREHQERAQAVGQAHLRWQMALETFNALLAKISQEAYAQFENSLAEREEPGRQIGSVRALFDLWVDAAEAAWAKAALSPEYRHAFGELTNAQMRLRSAVQAQVEQTTAALGLPGRTELDSAHRKIAELERQLRRMQRHQEAITPAPSAPSQQVTAPSPEVAAKAPVKAAAKSARRAARQPAATQPATKQATPKRQQTSSVKTSAAASVRSAPRKTVKAAKSLKPTPSPARKR